MLEKLTPARRRRAGLEKLLRAGDAGSALEKPRRASGKPAGTGSYGTTVTVTPSRLQAALLS